MRRTAGGNGVGAYPVASQVRRNPESRAPDKPVGHAAHGCGGPCVETLRKRAFLGMALSAEAPPSVSDVRGVMMRVPRGCEGTRFRPSCGIISERVSQVRRNHQKKRRRL